MSETPPSTTATTPPKSDTKPTLKKKGKKKKQKVKPVIPKNLTANLGETQKKERESEPEVFEKVSKPKPKASTTKSSDESSSTSASSNSAESTKASSNSTQSLPKLPPRPSKCVHEEGKDKIVEYKIDVGRTYSQSSGTLSYDSVFVADEAKVNTYRATGVTAKPVEVKFQPSKIIDLNAEKHIEQTTAFDDEKFQALVHGDECPAHAAPTPDYLFGRREQELAKKAIMVTVEEFFATPRDDMDLTIRVQRNGTFPILDTKITPNPRTNIISTLSTSDASSSSQFSSFSSSSTTSVDPEGCLNG